MKNTLKITLKANEKIYINGAVIKTDRKVSLEFLNDVHFLLEGHVLQPDQATTPLRQLYFIVQMILMNPEGASEAREMLRRSMPLLLACFTDEHILASLKHIDRLVNESHVYEALKAIRGLYVLEAEIMDRDGTKHPTILTAAE
ncbi:flagellar biosynthesis repressor FlbT [Aquamicrobium zhengzhouense]|uniref:Probable flagellum biosynthesis repressor protein FlbT n=1 Tax=Aquamicrobium zhengzhouense TaxID=2781738 RepID=A0ABS0S8V5_9HYPH|nr:flagellar biosynthesis repressor FlbT [Aquamicrobium zhengzhouense]MBI1619728.1 flagellar biosynthesis repressor FlbT [Aquamicrobium zhengzhouense]